MSQTTASRPRRARWSRHAQGAAKAPRPRLRRRRVTGLVFAAPLIVYLVLFYAYPLAVNVSMSLRRFTRATYVTGDAPFAGADIYKEVLASPQFWPTVEQTAIFVVVSLVFQYTIGLALAVFFYTNFPLSTVLRGLFLVPWLLPIIVSATTWQWMMDADNGILNRFLGLFGVDPIWWLNADNSLWAVIIANIWLGIPFNLVILYSGLQNISKDLYEAAELDGAGPLAPVLVHHLPAPSPRHRDHPPPRLRLHPQGRRHHLDHDDGDREVPDPRHLGLRHGVRQGHLGRHQVLTGLGGRDNPPGHRAGHGSGLPRRAAARGGLR